MPQIRGTTPHHAVATGYNDTVTDIGGPVDGLPRPNVQGALEAVDDRLEGVEGPNADSLVGIALNQAPAGVTGRMSDGAPNNFNTLVPGNSFANLVNSLAFTLTIPAGNGGNFGQLGELVAVLNGVEQTDTFDLAAAFNAAEAFGSQSYPPASSGGNTITVTSVQKFGPTSLFQIVKGRINLIGTFDAPGILSGENEIFLRHLLVAGNQDSNAVIFFYDSNGTRPSVVLPPTILEDTLSSSKYISGVQKYTTGDTFTLGGQLSGAFNNTFHDTPLAVQGAAVGIANYDVAYNDPNVLGPSMPPAVGDGFTYSENGKAINVANVLTENGRITVFGRDPFGSGASSLSNSENRMVNTYGTVSTAVLEEFRDENRRLSYFNTQGDNGSGVNNYNSIPVAVTGQWTGSTLLGNGEALLFNDGLTYPTNGHNGGDFTSGVLPGGQTADYSGFSGSQYYARAMVGVNPHSSGTLKLAGWALADFNTLGSPKAKVEIKLPSQTGWLDLGKPFNVGTFTGADGDGCRTSATGSDFGWTSGTFNTVNSGLMYIVRVTLLNATAPLLTQMQETTVGF